MMVMVCPLLFIVEQGVAVCLFLFSFHLIPVATTTPQQDETKTYMPTLSLYLGLCDRLTW
eukprot:m.250204 g.250204  ORF g.250204 m.250204 type:complete len:60 (+) comp76948_c0_seq1:34-213(+)